MSNSVLQIFIRHLDIQMYANACCVNCGIFAFETNVVLHLLGSSGWSETVWVSLRAKVEGQVRRRQGGGGVKGSLSQWRGLVLVVCAPSPIIFLLTNYIMLMNSVLCSLFVCFLSADIFMRPLMTDWFVSLHLLTKLPVNIATGHIDADCRKPQINIDSQVSAQGWSRLQKWKICMLKSKN